MISLLLCLLTLLNAVIADPLLISLPTKLPTAGISPAVDGSFLSFSIEPAFYTDFFGDNSTWPNNLTLSALYMLSNRTGTPSNIRPGGDTQDKMSFDYNLTSRPVERTVSGNEIKSIVVGPEYYKLWRDEVWPGRYISTLNFASNNLTTTTSLVVASTDYANASIGKILAYELGNQPDLYPDFRTRWANGYSNGSTAYAGEYVNQWQIWTRLLDGSINGSFITTKAKLSDIANLTESRWWASSASQQPGAIDLSPAEVIRMKIDRKGQVGAFTMHHYLWDDCQKIRQGHVDISSILNVKDIKSSIDQFLKPSIDAALKHGKPFYIGQGNAVPTCPAQALSNTDTFAQSLYTILVQLISATRGVTAYYLHQGASLTGQQADSTHYSFTNAIYPRGSAATGAARLTSGFPGLLFMAEAIGNSSSTRFLELDSSPQEDPDHLLVVAMYDSAASKEADRPARIAVINSQPWLYSSGDQAKRPKIGINLASLFGKNEKIAAQSVVRVKRLTAAHADEAISSRAWWAGQEYSTGAPTGTLTIEAVSGSSAIEVAASEAVLIHLSGPVYNNTLVPLMRLSNGKSYPHLGSNHAAPLMRAQYSTVLLVASLTSILLSCQPIWG
ncbi:unnamed protein product [Sympodiomycopsis kandeliae]